MKKIEQGTPEWLEMRKRYLGASDIPVLMEESPYKTPYQLWQEKLGLSQPQKMTESMEYGQKNEENIRGMYEIISGYKMTPQVIFHPKIDYLMASLDGLNEYGTFAVEIKCNNHDNHCLAKEGQIPYCHYGQLMAQMECLGHDKIDYVSYHKGDLVTVCVSRDDEYIEKMLKKCHMFWQSVLNLEEPPLVDADFRERDANWKRIAEMLWDLEEKNRLNGKLAGELKEELKQMSEGQNSKSGEYRFIGTSRRGSINYEAIPELENVNLEKYRKPATKSWSLKRSY